MSTVGPVGSVPTEITLVGLTPPSLLPKPATDSRTDSSAPSAKTAPVNTRPLNILA